MNRPPSNATCPYCDTHEPNEPCSQHEAGALTAVLARVLIENGAEAGSGLHSWRCEYPDRYGPCSCVEEVVGELTTAVLTFYGAP